MFRREKEHPIIENASQHLPKSYHMKSLPKFISIIVAFIFVAATGGFIWNMLSKPFSFLTSWWDLLFIGISLFNLFINLVYLNDRIEVSREGVAYHGLGFRVYTPWENIIRLAQVKRHPHLFLYRGPVPVFVFRSPALLDVPISEGKRRGVAVIEKRWLAFSTKPHTYNSSLPIVSLHIPFKDLSHHEIGQYLRLYAPQVEQV